MDIKMAVSKDIS